MTTPREVPGSAERLARRLAEAAGAGARVRPVGGGTKLGWGRDAPVDLELSTAGLAEVREHNAGDFVAVLQGGVPLATAQRRFAAAGQRLALDPPLGAGDAATLGGVLATGDSGPLRHRYGAPRDLVLGVTLALSDGTLARAGGKVIKNVAGYDLGKLAAGSFGTLGVIVEAAVRLHPLPPRTATAIGRGDDPARVAAAASALAHQRLELESLDVRWAGDEGAVLARAAGAVPQPLADRAATALRESGLDAEVVEDDDELWARQREGQRARWAAGGEPAREASALTSAASGPTPGPFADVVVRVSGLQSRLGDVLTAARWLGAEVVGRAALGLCWVRLPGGAEAVGELRAALAPLSCVVLDAPPEVRAALDPWGEVDAAAVELMRRVKARFDPAGALSPGTFVGGL
jgi:glycolate oxidase FAD binding subunit